MQPERLIGLLGESDRRHIVASLLLGATTRDQIANATGLSTRAIVDSLARLEQGGLVEVIPDGDVILLEAAFEMAARSRRPKTQNHEPDASEDEILLAKSVASGRIIHWPSKQSKQRVVLDWLVQRFEPGVKYTERQVNSLIVGAHMDTAAMRRYLVDFGMLDRSDGEYWRSGGSVEV